VTFSWLRLLNSPDKFSSGSIFMCLCGVIDYTSFVKRVIRLVQTYLSVKNVELEMRPFTDDDETLDARGQPLVASSSTTTRSPPSAAANVDDHDKNVTEVTSPVDVNAELAASKRKTRKKRKSARKSEEIEEVTTDQFVTGLHVFLIT